MAERKESARQRKERKESNMSKDAKTTRERLKRMIEDRKKNLQSAADFFAQADRSFVVRRIDGVYVRTLAGGKVSDTKFDSLSEAFNATKSGSEEK